MVPFLLNCGYPVLIWDTTWSPPRVINKKGNTSTFCGPECEVSILNLSTLFLKYFQAPLSTKTAFSFLSGKNFPYVGIIHPLYTMADSEVLFSDHHILLLVCKRNLLSSKLGFWNYYLMMHSKNYSLKLRVEQWYICSRSYSSSPETISPMIQWVGGVQDKKETDYQEQLATNIGLIF